MTNNDHPTDQPGTLASTGAGRFITLEGIEGSGKSTLLPYVQGFLEAAGKSVVATREPGGTMVGEALRRILLDPAHDRLTSDAELLMIFAARIEHLEKVIKPALSGGSWVVCDRFADATYVYQGAGRNIPSARIDALTRWVRGLVFPDLTLVLDVPASLGLQRVGRRGHKDRFEREQQVFFERLRDAYLGLAARQSARCRVIDASLPLEEVRQRVSGILRAFLRGLRPNGNSTIGHGSTGCL